MMGTVVTVNVTVVVILVKPVTVVMVTVVLVAVTVLVADSVSGGSGDDMTVEPWTMTVTEMVAVVMVAGVATVVINSGGRQ
jgi:flagellar motor switch protein FliM